MKRKNQVIAVILLALLLLPYHTAYGFLNKPEPVGWRNDGTGDFTKATVPTQWSDDENVIYKTPLPGFSNASPILVKNKIFICAEPDVLICVNAKNGKILWQKEFAVTDLSLHKNNKLDAATPTDRFALRDLGFGTVAELGDPGNSSKENPDAY